MAQPQLPCQQRVIAVTQRNEGYPPKSANHVLLQKIIKYHFMATFFFSPTGPVSSHHPITTRPLGAKPAPQPSRCEISLRKVLVKTESMPPTCLKQVVRCEVLVSKIRKKDEKHNSSTKNHCVSKQKCPTSEENSKRESEIGQNSVVF